MSVVAAVDAQRYKNKKLTNKPDRTVSYYLPSGELPKELGVSNFIGVHLGDSKVVLVGKLHGIQWEVKAWRNYTELKTLGMMSEERARPQPK
jgi:hypothetical protein